MRRGGAKALAALLRAYPDLLAELYPQVAPPLRARFREREETVKADVFATLVVLLQQVRSTAWGTQGSGFIGMRTTSRGPGFGASGSKRALKADVFASFMVLLR